MKYFLLLAVLPCLGLAYDCPDPKVSCSEGQMCCEIGGKYTCCASDEFIPEERRQITPLPATLYRARRENAAIMTTAALLPMESAAQTENAVLMEHNAVRPLAAHLVKIAVQQGAVPTDKGVVAPGAARRSRHVATLRTHVTAREPFSLPLSQLFCFCCQVIYSQFGLAIHQNDHQARRRFVEWAQNEIAVVPDFHKRILFSDEAHFWLNGYVNKQNCRIWSEANPQVYVETPLHPEKLTVWCALWAGGIIGPYFFKNDEGHNVTVNGDRYRAMITNFFISELNNHDVQKLWFQQDGATCHTARATIDLLKDTFGDRLISRFGPVNWLNTARLFSVGLCKVIGLCG
ncbi:DUF4817 domain-containing protein [Trichonephila clavipes]|nr:DUF4817 domain-containing protein [Trichonephila clavipes]